MKRFLTFLFILSVAPLLTSGKDTAEACGVLTHGEITQRGVHAFADPNHPEYETRLRVYRGALLAGAGFPDWGWMCGYLEEAEVSHTVAMVETAADYVRETYPRPWDEETEQTAVFLLGFLSHVVSDIRYTTHQSESYEEGFLGVMHALEFPGSFDFAHHFGDAGGDIFNAYQEDLAYFEPWYVPTADMVAVYQLLGYERVTPEIIESMMGLLYLLDMVERAAGWLAHDLFCRFTVFQKENHQDFFAGGVDDMGLLSARRWVELIARLEGSQDAGGLTVAAAQPRPEEDGLWAYWLARGQAMLAAGELTLRREHTTRGLILHGARRRPPERNTIAGKRSAGPDRTLTFLGDVDYAYLGSSLAMGDFNGDGRADVAMGSPGYGGPGMPQLGAVRIMFSGREIEGDRTIDLATEPADLELSGEETAGRFGWDVAVVDLNGDGLDDLAVSAPTVGAPDDEFLGKVRVYFGTGETLAGEAGLTIEAREHRHNLGWRLAGGDVDGDGCDDLLIGSPFTGGGGNQRGQVAVFLAAQDWPAGAVAAPEDAAWLLHGENDYDWFGFDVGATVWPDGGRVLLVGAPKFDADEALSAGRLYGYAAVEMGQTPLFTLTGADKFDQVGTAFTAVSPLGDGHRYLLAAASSRTAAKIAQAGEVRMLAMEELTGDLLFDETMPAAVFRGLEAFARFGRRLGVVDFNMDGVDDLWLAAPYRETTAGFEAGAAYLFFGGEAFPEDREDITPDAARWSIHYEAPRALFGGALAFTDFNDDGYPDAVFGARQATDQARHGGRVVVVPAPVPELQGLEPAVARAGRLIVLTLTGKRLTAEDSLVQFKRGETWLTAVALEAVDEETLRFDLEIPADADAGAYDLHFSNLFGEGGLPAALEITAASADDDDDNDDDNDNDDNDDDAVVPGDDDETDDDSPGGELTDDDDDDDETGCCS